MVESIRLALTPLHVCAVACAIASFASSDARACTRPAADSAGFDIAPDDGATGFPTDGFFLDVGMFSFNGELGPSELVLRPSGGDALSVEETFIRIESEEGIAARAKIMRPTSALEPSTRYELSTAEGEPRIMFTTGEGPLGDAPPAAPVVAVIEAVAPTLDHTGMSCSFPGSARVSLERGVGDVAREDESAPRFALVHDGRGVPLETDAVVLALARGADAEREGVTVFLEPGTHQLFVHWLDATGRISPASEVEVTVPEPVVALRPFGCAGCAATGADASMGALCVALWMRRVRGIRAGSRPPR